MTSRTLVSYTERLIDGEPYLDCCHDENTLTGEPLGACQGRVLAISWSHRDRGEWSGDAVCQAIAHRTEMVERAQRLGWTVELSPDTTSRVLAADTFPPLTVEGEPVPTIGASTMTMSDHSDRVQTVNGGAPFISIEDLRHVVEDAARVYGLCDDGVADFWSSLGMKALYRVTVKARDRRNQDLVPIFVAENVELTRDQVSHLEDEVVCFDAQFNAVAEEAFGDGDIHLTPSFDTYVTVEAM